MIPKVINQIWIGPRKLSDEHAGYIQKWKEMYPDFEHIFWDDIRVEETEIIPPDKRLYYYSEGYPIAFKADLLRYEIIKKYGGMYVDVDTEPLRKMEDAFFDFVFFGGVQPGNLVAIGLFAAVKQCPLIVDVCREVTQNIDTHLGRVDFGEQLDKITGPTFFTSICERYFQNPDYFFVPPKYFYPYPYWDLESRAKDPHEAYPEAYSVHHWSKNWV